MSDIASNVAACLKCRRSHSRPPCAGACPCPVDGVNIGTHAAADFCGHPDGPMFGAGVKPDLWEMKPRSGESTAAPAPKPVETRPWMEVIGPKLWSQLHRFALTTEARLPGRLAAFFAELRKYLTCGACAEGLDDYLAAHPIEHERPFEWTVELHNWVNAKPSLNKPQLSVEEARAIHAEGGDRSGVEPASIGN